MTGEPLLEPLCRCHRFHRRVFFAPPWAAPFEADAERRHGFTDAVAKHARLLVDYPRPDYEVVPLPEAPVPERAAFVLATSGERPRGAPAA